ncbi:MAG: hypothetical protein KME22_03035 [Hassallia sp. WJT32-NPBG1]|nr:hypothetical protein [Spirirestis rafaelensis WJT71-NPBG6]MBW4606208.1 hypothetical protein [Hassallia sp. WJT32-NPBG1]
MHFYNPLPGYTSGYSGIVGNYSQLLYQTFERIDARDRKLLFRTTGE